MNKFKTIGLGLVTIVAMSAIGASAAQAAEEFRVEAPKNGKDAAIVTGEIVPGGPATVSAPHTFQATPGGLTGSCKMTSLKRYTNRHDIRRNAEYAYDNIHTRSIGLFDLHRRRNGDHHRMPHKIRRCHN